MKSIARKILILDLKVRNVGYIYYHQIELLSNEHQKKKSHLSLRAVSTT
jgi:hypothetical protein